MKRQFIRLLKETNSYNLYFHYMKKEHPTRIIGQYFDTITHNDVDLINLIEASYIFAKWNNTKEGMKYWTTLNLLWHIILFENKKISDNTLADALRQYENRIKPSSTTYFFITEKDKKQGRIMFAKILEHIFNNKKLYENVINSL